jgi:glucosamine-phosphate N-acetyltransferase
VKKSIVIRRLVEDDLYRGFLDVLNTLRPTLLLPEAARAVYAERETNGWLATLVALDISHKGGPLVVGTASLLVEKKYLHGGQSVGHIEDVAVLPSYQGQDVGSDLVSTCVKLSQTYGCYKAILNCAENVRPFYEKIGFAHRGDHMRVDLP